MFHRNEGNCVRRMVAALVWARFRDAERWTENQERRTNLTRRLYVAIGKKNNKILTHGDKIDWWCT